LRPFRPRWLSVIGTVVAVAGEAVMTRAGLQKLPLDVRQCGMTPISLTKEIIF
jgi:hypothetical protein